MFKKPEKVCPLLKSECVETRCMFWTHIRGRNPQGGAEIDLHDCTIRWLPTLLIENAQMERQTGAAVESMRNEMVNSARGLTQSIALAAANAGPAQIERRGNGRMLDQDPPY